MWLYAPLSPWVRVRDVRLFVFASQFAHWKLLGFVFFSQWFCVPILIRFYCRIFRFILSLSFSNRVCTQSTYYSLRLVFAIDCMYIYSGAHCVCVSRDEWMMILFFTLSCCIVNGKNSVNNIFFPGWMPHEKSGEIFTNSKKFRCYQIYLVEDGGEQFKIFMVLLFSILVFPLGVCVCASACLSAAFPCLYNNMGCMRLPKIHVYFGVFVYLFVLFRRFRFRFRSLGYAFDGRCRRRCRLAMLTRLLLLLRRC